MESRLVRLGGAILIGFGAPLVYWAVPGGKTMGSLTETLLLGAILAVGTALWLEYGATKRNRASVDHTAGRHDADQGSEQR